MAPEPPAAHRSQRAAQRAATRAATQEKAARRTELRAVRRAITADPAERAARSARIWAAIVARGLLGGDRLDSERHPTRIMLFRSLPAEPDTSAWADWCRHRRWAVFLPEVDGTELRVEPGDVDPATLDVVVVPGLGFTPDGHRLGQGGGHYDRFLARLAADCITIGVCFAEQLVAVLPVEDHDAPVDVVITDRDHPAPPRF